MTMTREEAKKIIKEFHTAHSKYSSSVGGHWGKNWKEKLVHAELIDGYWYWKGYCIYFLQDKIDKHKI